MDPALSSLFPIHQIGADGFSWWVGQVESGKGKDPKNSGRYQVRIMGTHLKDGDITPTDSLPWAQVMMPVTTPFSVGGKTGASVGLDTGSWVVGFFLDNDKQKPIIMGSIGHTAGATQRTNIETDPNPGGTEKGFGTFLAPDVNQSTQIPMASKDARKGDQPAAATTAETSGTTKPGEAGLIAAAVPDQMPPSFYGLFAEASTTNPTGNKVCVEIANPNCGSENDMKGGLTNIIGEMLRATQQSNGNLGTYYISKINGELNSYIDHGMSYVNKAVRLVKSFVSRVKGEIVKLIREGADKLVELLLYEKVVEEKAEDAAAAADKSVIDDEGKTEPKKVKQSRIKGVLDTINETLDDIGCSMADFTDRIAQWLTDLLLGYLMDAFSNAACLVDNVVDGILNQILSFLEELIGNILGPLQQLLSAIASPIDMVGNAINKVLNLLGISCDGPEAQCEKITKECTDCGTGETEDWLDKLISDIEGGPLDGSTYVCDEAKNTSALESLPPTNIIFIGGTYPDGDIEKPVVPTDVMITYQIDDIEVTEGEKATFIITRSGAINTASSVKMSVLGGTATQGEDYNKIFSGGSVGFSPGSVKRAVTFETYKDNITEGSESFFVKIEENVTPTGMIAKFQGGKSAKCTILDFTNKSISPGGGDGEINDEISTTPFVPPSLINILPIEIEPLVPDFVPSDIPEILLSSDKIYYNEGEKIKYTVQTLNIPGGSTYNYTIEGTVDENDIEGGLTGTFTTDSTGFATFNITTLVNDDNTDTVDENGATVVVVDDIESISLYIDDTTVFTDAFILGDADDVVRWAVDSDKTYISEGETATMTVSTTNIPDGTNFTYELVGDISVTDIVGYRLVSNVDVDAQPLQIIDGQCIIPITPAIDGDEDETAESFNFVIRSYVNSNGDTIAISDTFTSVTILADNTIGDDDDSTPAYFVDAENLTYREGEVIKYNITTDNVVNGTVLQYMLSGSGIKPSDVSTNSLFGTFQVINNEAVVYIGIEEDNEIESDETLAFTIVGTGAFADVVIIANGDEQIPSDPDPKKPCFTKPIAGKPITDDNGSIISIPIEDSGCPFVLPPKIIITGPGYGAGAIPLLDANGRVTEVRVTRSGVGYNVNQNPELRCVIDAYTIINPGTGYTTPPQIYIDGVAGRAEAIIDDKGFVISIRPTDRTNTYNEIPKVQIIGGGGLGARVIPSIVCLDTIEYEDQGYAKIGTGRYVDCP